MLTLLTAPSGAGKTEYLFARIREDVERGIPTLLLVPEQQAYSTERSLATRLPGNAGLYFSVVDFSGLAESAFRKYGGVTTLHVSPAVRTLLMWETLRTLSPTLRCYPPSAATDPALSHQMLATVDELRACGMDAERLEEAAKQLPESHPLCKKLSDIALIDAAFHASNDTGCTESLSDRLVLLSALLDEHRAFAGYRLYVDSFTDFTVQELEVLRRILLQADAVTVALCTDAIRSRLPHFETVSDTARKLERMAREWSIPVRHAAPLAGTDRRPAALRQLSEKLWSFHEATASPVSPANDDVRLVQCANVYEEAECTALQILELIQEGMHFGDIAVVMRDAEAYRGILDAALERYRIPYFLSERTELANTPLSRLLLSALRAVLHGYRASDVISLVKTGLTGADTRDAALFEEYCETWHITGSRFRDPVWNMNPDGLTTTRSARAEDILAAANRVRATVMAPLEQLALALRASDRLPNRCRALYQYLCQCNVAAQLSQRAAEEVERNEIREAGESLRLYRFAVDTLTELATLLPEARMSLEELIYALEILFSAADLGSVPMAHDCVILGSASTLRVENVRASFLLGLCEGEFPRAVTDDGILTESDKCTLEGLGILLDSREKRRTADELFYVYRAISKPSEKLRLLTVLANTDASAKTPSMAFMRARQILGCEVEEFHPEELTRPLAKDATEETPVYLAPPLPAGTELWLSQSKINTFALCPYRFYCTYRLKLRDKKDSTTSYADDGVFLHAVMEGFLRASLGEDNQMHFPPPEELETLVDAIIDRYVAEVCPMPKEWLDNRLLHLFARLRGIALLILRDLVEELRHSRFVPTYFEERIGSHRENGLPAVMIPLTDGSTVHLSGVIDRVDLYREGDAVYVRVVDYKTSEHRFDVSKVRSGEDIQLILYLHAMLSAAPGQYRSGGAEFLYTDTEDGIRRVVRSGLLVDDETVLDAADDTEKRSYTRSLKKFSTEELTALIEEMRTAVASIARRILDGEATKTPSEDACRYCPVADHCDRACRK